MCLLVDGWASSYGGATFFRGAWTSTCSWGSLGCYSSGLSSSSRLMQGVGSRVVSLNRTMGTCNTGASSMGCWPLVALASSAAAAPVFFLLPFTTSPCKSCACSPSYNIWMNDSSLFVEGLEGLGASAVAGLGALATTGLGALAIVGLGDMALTKLVRASACSFLVLGLAAHRGLDCFS